MVKLHTELIKRIKFWWIPERLKVFLQFPYLFLRTWHIGTSFMPSLSFPKCASWILDEGVVAQWHNPLIYKPEQSSGIFQPKQSGKVK